MLLAVLFCAAAAIAYTPGDGAALRFGAWAITLAYGMLAVATGELWLLL